MSALAHLLGGELGMAVIAAWRPLAEHGRGCVVCAPAVASLASIPDEAAPFYDAMCEAGQEAFLPWMDAKSELIARLLDLAQPWGLSGFSPEMAEERAAALTALPAAAAQDIYATADHGLRAAKIRAVVEAWRRTGRVTQGPRVASPPRRRQHRLRLESSDTEE